MRYKQVFIFLILFNQCVYPVGFQKGLLMSTGKSVIINYQESGQSFLISSDGIYTPSVPVRGSTNRPTLTWPLIFRLAEYAAANPNPSYIVCRYIFACAWNLYSVMNGNINRQYSLSLSTLSPTEARILLNNFTDLFHDLDSNSHTSLQIIGRSAHSHCVSPHYMHFENLLRGFSIDSGDFLLNMAFYNEDRIFHYVPTPSSGGLNINRNNPDYRIIRFETSDHDPRRRAEINIYLAVIAGEGWSSTYEIRAVTLNNGDDGKVSLEDKDFIKEYRRDNDDNGAGSAGSAGATGGVRGTTATTATIATTARTARTTRTGASSGSLPNHESGRSVKLTGQDQVNLESTPIKSLIGTMLTPSSFQRLTLEK